MSDVLRVICLCAQWCGVCRDYAALFAQTGLAFESQCGFVWIDIEDQAEHLDGIDVENFPTLLIARGDEVLFFGTVTPHVPILQRLVERAVAHELPAQPASAEINALIQHLSSRNLISNP
jgi:thioredoxin 1